MDEQTYLLSLRSEGRQADLAGRIRDLRDHGWSVSQIAEEMQIARQWLYMLLAKFPDAHSASDAPPFIEDLRPEPEIPLHLDRAKLPHSLADTISALWRLNLYDRSAGSSPVAKALDTMLMLLRRRGMPHLAIAQDAGVTHRAVIARYARALERGTVSNLDNYLKAPKYVEPRVREERIPGRDAFCIFQVVTTTYPRFYTLRDSRKQLFLFTPYTAQPHPYLVEAGLEDFELLPTENQFVQAVANAQPDESPVYAVPAQWLYVESAPAYIWDKQNYDLLEDFYPPKLKPTGYRDTRVLKSFTDPRSILRQVTPINWKANNAAS